MRIRKAVLIIHGFTGNLYDNEYLMNYLQYKKFDVYAWTLPGHDKDRYSDCKFKDWIEFEEEKLQILIRLGYKKIYIVGHSMGGVIGSYLASKYPEIKKIVYVNAAFDYFNLKQNKEDIFNKDDNEGTTRNLKTKLLRISPSIILEFRQLVKRYKTIIKDVDTESLILQSTKDEIVPTTTGQYIYDELKSDKKYLTYIKNGRHTVLSSNLKESVSLYIFKFLEGGRKWKKNYKNEI